MLVVECLRQEIRSGSTLFPVYVGFLPAKDIVRVAEAPAFTETTAHQQIASNIASQPVRDWQRPLDHSRVTAIAGTFNDTGRLMPNPILLGQNAFVNGKITLTPKQIGSGQLSGTWQVNIDDSSAQPGQLPLWILDGQHRVAGLSQSLQSTNPVPIVFLLDGGSGAYTSPLLASLFAQVTTSATQLDELHDEWLTYAFHLGSYNAARPSAASERDAFDAVVQLCRTPTFSNQANPFLNAVQFNEHVPVHPSHGGFGYKCTELKNLFFRAYYNQPTAVGHLTPTDLAAQVALAYGDLWSVVASQQNNVFFGTSGQQTIMQDAYLTGVLARILRLGPQTSWRTLLQSLMFHQSNWDFSWVRSLSGPANTASKKIATDVLSDALTSGVLPTGSSNVPDHLRGNGAAVTLTFSPLTPSGRAAKHGRQQIQVLRGGTGSQPASHTPHVKVTAQSTNIGKLEVLDAATPGGKVQYPQVTGRGMVLTATPGLPNPLELMFTMTHYGGLESAGELRVSW
jgi:hypothetical protein